MFVFSLFSEHSLATILNIIVFLFKNDLITMFTSILSLMSSLVSAWHRANTLAAAPAFTQVATLAEEQVQKQYGCGEFFEHSFFVFWLCFSSLCNSIVETIFYFIHLWAALNHFRTRQRLSCYFVMIHMVFGPKICFFMLL